MKTNALNEVVFCLQVPEDHGEDDSSEKTPSKASKSPQKSTKRPKTIPVKVSLLDGSDYEAAVEVCSHSLCTHSKFPPDAPSSHDEAAPWQPELSCSHCFHRPSPRNRSAFCSTENTCCAHCFDGSCVSLCRADCTRQELHACFT